MRIPVFLNGDYKNVIGYLELQDTVDIYEDARFSFTFTRKNDARPAKIKLYSLSLDYSPVKSKDAQECT